MNTKSRACYECDFWAEIKDDSIMSSDHHLYHQTSAVSGGTHMWQSWVEIKHSSATYVGCLTGVAQYFHQERSSYELCDA